MKTETGMRAAPRPVAPTLRALALALATLVLVLLPPVQVQRAQAADEMLDASRQGSISISPESSDGKGVSGTFALYKVADVVADDTGWHFQWTDAYRGTDHELYRKTGTLSDSYKKKLVGLLEGKVAHPVQTRATRAGAVSFSGLSVGLYLVKMTKVESGYDTIDPFLVSIPTIENGALVYQVNASPKAGAAKAKADVGGNGGSGGGDSGAADERLPQTGQLWWPVPVLAGVGIALVVAGVLRRRGSRRDDGAR